jgi:predicted Zn finger-like uncharacterized protein
VVVSCQKCRTRFQLDEARIPKKGVRVRCSKCKHAFFVGKPGAEDEALHGVAEEAAKTGRASPSRPVPAVDLGAKDSEDDWQFNIEPPGGAARQESFADDVRSGAREDSFADGPGAPTPPPAEITDSEPTDLGGGGAESYFELDGLPDRDRDAAPEAEAAKPEKKEKAGKAENKKKQAPPDIEPEQEVDFRNLGNPESWNSPEKRSAATKGKKAAKGAAAEKAEEARAALRSTLPRVAPGALVGSLGGAAAWGAAALLFAFGLQGALSAPPADAVLAPLAIGGLQMTDVRVRHLENVFAGPLVVVAGELRNPGTDGARAEAAPLVRVTDELGEALDLAPVWLGVEISDDELRRGDPAGMAAAQARAARALAERSFAANERVPVVALLADLPAEAVGFRIESVPLAELPGAPAPPPVPEAELVAPADAAPPGTNDGAPLDAP